MQINLERKDSSITLISFDELSSPTEKGIEGKEEYWFSYEDKERYEEKEREKSEMELTYCNSLSSLSLSLSDDSNNFKRDGNSIIKEGKYKWESCLIGEIMDEGVHRISFFVNSVYLIGVIDSSKRLPLYGRSITETHIGLLLMIYICIYINYHYLIYRCWNEQWFILI